MSRRAIFNLATVHIFGKRRRLRPGAVPLQLPIELLRLQLASRAVLVDTRLHNDITPNERTAPNADASAPVRHIVIKHRRKSLAAGFQLLLRERGNAHPTTDKPGDNGE